MKALGIETDEEDDLVYYFVDYNVKAKNAVYTSGTMYESWNLYHFYPRLWGSETPDGKSVINSFDQGFRRTLWDKVGETEMTSGKSYSYDVSGKTVVAGVKGATNYMVVENDTTDIEYSKSLMYFALD